MVSFADNTQDVSLSKYDKLYHEGNYGLILKELIFAVNQFENTKSLIVTASNVVHARNLVADSYRMLKKYNQAAQWYGGTNEGYFDNYAKYGFLLIKKISVIKGKEEQTAVLKFQHYNGGAGSNPPHEGTLQIILGQLLNNHELTQKKIYLQEWASYDKNNDWVTSLTRFCAGDLKLDALTSIVPKENLTTAITYAGLSLEVSGEIAKARELYTQVLAEKSNKIEALLAANRMGLLALKMIYTTESGLTGLSNVYAVKVSSAKLEDARLYSASNLIDGDPKTAWVPVSNKSGIGEWVEFSFDDPMQVNSLLITNGYAKSTESFIRNNRIKTATLEFSDGSKSIITLQDTSKPQTIAIRKKTRTIRLIIDAVYRGTMYDDTCLSDVELEVGK